MTRRHAPDAPSRPFWQELLLAAAAPLASAAGELVREVVTRKMGAQETAEKPGKAEKKS